MRAVAYAKLNLGLVVRSPDRSGYHPLVSLMQSITWTDAVAVTVATEDEMVVVDEIGSDPPVPAGVENLAWQAADRLRRAAGRDDRLAVRVTKRIPAAAGLGGGSADAAATLGLTALCLEVDPSLPGGLAPGLGADVPFCLIGGTAMVEGRGDHVTVVSPASGGYAAAVVVPPVVLSTAAVYRCWDELGGPAGPVWDDAHLPPSLRRWSPLRNDLYPAAAHLSPEVADWRRELQRSWGREVAMTGSGPALFGLFPNRAEAQEAVAAAPPGRGAAAVEASTAGWLAVTAEE